MHKEVKDFIKSVKKNNRSYFFMSDVVEFGSLNINGSTRKHFWFCDYLGVDIGKGRGVDVVCKAHEFDNHLNYDVVVSTEMLEHDCHWYESLTNMYKCLREEGLMIITCAAPNRPEHGTKRTTPQDSPFTGNYYRNISIEDFREALPPEWFKSYYLMYGRDGYDLFFMGIK